MALLDHPALELLFGLGPDDFGNETGNLFIVRPTSQKALHIVLLIRKKAGLQLPIRRESDPVAVLQMWEDIGLMKPILPGPPFMVKQYWPVLCARSCKG